MLYEVFTGLYDTMAWSTISYGAAIWGTKNNATINTFQNRASSFFLSVGKYIPNAVVCREMGSISPYVRRQWKNVLGH